MILVIRKRGVVFEAFARCRNRRGGRGGYCLIKVHGQAENGQLYAGQTRTNENLRDAHEDSLIIS